MAADSEFTIESSSKKTSISIKRILISTVFLGCLIIFISTNDQVFFEEFSSTSSPTSSLMSLMRYDFEKLKKSNSIPSSLYDIRQIQFFNRSESINLVQSELENFTQLKQSGKFKLTVELYPFPEEETSHLVQFNWINIKTKDKVWEINRVYKLGKKKPGHF